jgi:hypothetical protein
MGHVLNHFERVAIFTAIDSIETQLRGLKTLIAAAAGIDQQAHRTTRTIDPDSNELSDIEEDRLEKEIQRARTEELERMSKHAAGFFEEQWSDIVGGKVIPPVPEAQHQEQ